MTGRGGWRLVSRVRKEGVHGNKGRVLLRLQKKSSWNLNARGEIALKNVHLGLIE